MRTEIKVFRGKPTIFLDGTPFHSFYSSMDSIQMKSFIDAGFQVFDTHPYMFSGWVGENTYDYSLTDKRIEAFLSLKKDALLIVRFWMEYEEKQKERRNTKIWWTENNADQCVQLLSENGAIIKSELPCYASLKWRKEAGEALKKAIEHIECKYGDNIFAYIPGSGPCGEWLHWYTYAPEANRYPEGWSIPMQTGFREYLRDIYNDDISLLNRKWKSDFSSFEEIYPPNYGQRFISTCGTLRAPDKEGQVLDYYEFFNRIVADTLVDWCGIAKNACGRSKIIMAFYGYHWACSQRHSLARSGHIHLQKALNSPDIDIIVAPYIYDFREMGGVISSQTVTGSVKKAGKLLMVESDPATCLKRGWTYDSHIPTNTKESLEVMKRDTAYALIKGTGIWYMDDVMSMEELAGGRYEHPELIKGLAMVRSVGEKYYKEAGVSNAEIAVLLHERSSFYFREAEPFLSPLVNMFKVWELERMGAPFDDFLLSDLKDLNTERYKLFIIPNCVYLSDEEIKLIREKCCKDGKTVIWCYTAGFLSDEGMSIERMMEVTGIKAGYTMEAGELTVELPNCDNRYLSGLTNGVSYGTNGIYLPIEDIKEQAALNCYPDPAEGFHIAPRFWAEDEQAEVLGTIKGLGKHGLVVKKLGNWTSVLSSAPMVPKEILRNIAREAGCLFILIFLDRLWHVKVFLDSIHISQGNAKYVFLINHM